MQFRLVNTSQWRVKRLKSKGLSLEVEVDNFGVKMKEQTETYKSLVAQYAEKLVKDWPVDEPLFDCSSLKIKI